MTVNFHQNLKSVSEFYSSSDSIRIGSMTHDRKVFVARILSTRNKLELGIEYHHDHSIEEKSSVFRTRLDSDRESKIGR